MCFYSEGLYLCLDRIISFGPRSEEKAVGLQFSCLNVNYPDKDLSQQTGSPEGQAEKLPRLRFLKSRVGEFSIALHNCHVTVEPFFSQTLSPANSIPYTLHNSQTFLDTLLSFNVTSSFCQYIALRDLAFQYLLKSSLPKTFRFLLNLRTQLWDCECCYRWVIMILSSMSSFSSSVSSVLFCLASSAAAAAAAFGSSASFFLRKAFLL